MLLHQDMYMSGVCFTIEKKTIAMIVWIRDGHMKIYKYYPYYLHEVMCDVVQ